MIGTEVYACASRLRRVDPTAKLVLTTFGVVVCLSAGGWLTGLGTVAALCFLTAWKGGTPPRVFFRLLRVPLFFLLLSTLTILFERTAATEEMLVGLAVGQWTYGISKAGFWSGVCLLCRALGCVASVYFMVLSTPITDLLLALRRLHVPQLLLSLMELIYRFIFVLTEAAKQIQVAQASRLGYQGLVRSYHSLGALISQVFIKAYRKSDQIFTSLEARGYTGELLTLPPRYESGKRVYLWCVMVTAFQMLCYWLEKGGLPN